jgi:hypothetical protein
MKRVFRIAAAFSLILLIAVQLLAQSDPPEPCFISAPTDTTPLHVGPGFNRGVAAFLPQNQPFEPIGQATADDGLWYQVDKLQIAPNLGANELWVALETVETTGDCDSVAASAPSAFVGAPSVAVPVGNAPVVTPAPLIGITPASGLWTLTMPQQMSRTCDGAEGNAVVETGEIYKQRQRTERLIIGPGNNNITFRFDIFTRLDGTNAFVGDVTYEDVEGADIYVEMGSETFMFGRINVNYDVDGYDCVGSIPIIIEYNVPRIPGNRGSIIEPTPLAP